jgi:hypothetical protein
MDLYIEIHKEKSDQVFTQNVDILIIKMVSIIIENVKNIKDKEDEIN